MANTGFKTAEEERRLRAKDFSNTDTRLRVDAAKRALKKLKYLEPLPEEAPKKKRAGGPGPV